MAPSAAATAPATPQEKPFVLPVLIFGTAEVRRLRRELESLDDYMRQSAVREPGKQPALPRVSRMLDTLASDNHQNLLVESDRARLARFVADLETSAPGIHISFSSDPSSSFTAKMVNWLRTNIHPHMLLQIGLQPSIAAGCMVRTTNKLFDFSLRQSFTAHRDTLLKILNDQPAPAAPTPAANPMFDASTPPAPAAAPAPAAKPDVPVAPAAAAPAKPVFRSAA